MIHRELERSLDELSNENIEVIEEIEDGLNQIYRIRFNGKSAVMKIHTEKKEDDFFHDYEGLAVQRFLKDNKMVPEVYRVSDTEDPSYFIMEDKKGVSGREIIEKCSVEDLEQIVYRLGEVLNSLHKESNLEEFGYLRRNGNEIEIWRKFDSWKKLISSHIEKDIADLERGAFSDQISLLKKSYRRKKSALDREYDPVLIHDDNRFSNLIVRNGKLKSIIDWATGYNGPPEFDIVKAEFLLIDHDLHHLNEETQDVLRDKLYDGYGRDYRNTNVREIHRLASLVYTMKGYSTWKNNYSDDKKKEILENLRSKAEEIAD